MLMDDMPDHELDWAAGAELVGASPKQLKFVQGLVAGLSKTAACRAAGYSGEGSTLRSHASGLAKSNKVRALLAWAKAGGAGPSDVPGSLDELRKILWKHARGADKNHSIKATEVLHKLAAQDREAKVSDDGFGDWRCARDFMTTNERDGAAAYVLLTKTSLCNLSMLHDLHARVTRTWPDVWRTLAERSGANGKAELANKLADPTWQRGGRELIWGEIGYVIDRDGQAIPDPEGRTRIDRVTPLPGWNEDRPEMADAPAIASADETEADEHAAV